MNEVLRPVDSPIRRRFDPEGSLPQVKMISDGSKLADMGDKFYAYNVGKEIGFCYLRLFFHSQQLLQQIGYIQVHQRSRGYGPAMYLLCFERAARLSAVHVSDDQLSDEARRHWESLRQMGIAVDHATDESRAESTLIVPGIRTISQFHVPVVTPNQAEDRF